MTNPEPALKGEFNNFGEALNAAREQFTDRLAYIDGSDRITYQDWIDAADSLGSHLLKRGVQPGDVVAIILPSCIDYAICFAAIERIGAVATGVNLRLGPKEKGGILNRCTPSLVIAEEDLDQRPENCGILLRSEIAALITDKSVQLPKNNRSLSDPAVIIWTSGTTGMPKGAWFDNRALRAVVKYAPPMSAPFDCRYVPTPFAHAGYMGRVWDQIGYGITFVMPSQPWSAQATLDLLLKEKMSVFGGAPTQWAKLMELDGFNAENLSHLRVSTAAMAPMPPDLAKRIVDRIQTPVITRYAMTECPSISGTDPEDPPEVLFTTIGRPIAGMEVELRDDQGNKVPDGEVGRLHVRAETMMRGYWNDAEMTAEALSEDGWLKSGDLARFDENGRLILAGRATDMYIRGGYNIYPLEVENTLSQHPGIANVAIIGKVTEVIGEIGIAFIVPQDPDAPPSLEEVREWCKSRIADYKAPDEIRIIDAIPVTPLMKVDKRALAKLVA